MNTDIDAVTSDGPAVETSELLGFLIKRFNEALASDDPKVPFLLQGLGVVVLGTDEELLANYKGLLASSILPPAEIIRRSVDIFQIALERDSDGRSSQRPPQEVQEDSEPDDKFCRRILMNASREGKIMAEQSDYRFFRVFEMLTWVGLQFDAEWLAEFEQVRRRFAGDPEGLIDAGRDIIRDALFRRRPSDRVQPFNN